MELITRTAKLVPHNRLPKSADGYATAYYHEPDAYDPSELGNILVVIEVLGGKHSQEVAELITQTLTDRYYLTSDQEPIDAVAQFERALREVNSQLRKYTDAGHANWMGKLSAVLAVFSGGQLHLSQAGSAHAYLVRKDQAIAISEGLGAKETPPPESTFSDVASGQLLSGDRIFLTTPSLLHHLSKQDLFPIISSSTANGAIQSISSSLQPGVALDRIAALVSEVTTADIMAHAALPEEPAAVVLGRPSRYQDQIKPRLEWVLNKLVAVSRKIMAKTAYFWRNTLAPLLKRGSKQALSASKGAAKKGQRLSVSGITKVKQLRSKPKSHL